MVEGGGVPMAAAYLWPAGPPASARSLEARPDALQAPAVVQPVGSGRIFPWLGSTLDVNERWRKANIVSKGYFPCLW